MSTNNQLTVFPTLVVGPLQLTARIMPDGSLAGFYVLASEYGSLNGNTTNGYTYANHANIYLDNEQVRAIGEFIDVAFSTSENLQNDKGGEDEPI